MYVCLRMVSFRVKVCVTCIVFLSNEIFRSKSRGRLHSGATCTREWVNLNVSFVNRKQSVVQSADTMQHENQSLLIGRWRLKWFRIGRLFLKGFADPIEYVGFGQRPIFFLALNNCSLIIMLNTIGNFFCLGSL